MAADPESDPTDNPGRNRIHRWEASEMDRHHNGHRRSDSPSLTVPNAPHLGILAGLKKVKRKEAKQE